MARCKLISDSGAIAVQTPYDPGFVNQLKFSIPNADRRWNPSQKVWMIAPCCGATIQNLCMQYFNELPLLPDVANAKPKIVQKIIEVRYIGITKDRGDDERSAYGWINGGWNVIFPEPVLRAWFDAPSTPDKQPNAYSVLSVKRDATDDEIKKGFRRMAKQWHPDACREPNAHEQFIAINHAYEILKNNRERYDAGLALEASLRNDTRIDTSNFVRGGYRTPLRCGLIMCEGTEHMGLFNVSKIFAWQDITDQYGRVLVASWKSGEDHFEEVWA